MRQLFVLMAGCFFTSVNAQDHKLEKIWETDSIVAVPESVLPVNGTLYISLIDGSPWEADGKGGIGKLDTDGKNYKGDWITGLHAPKGMGIMGNRLYVADISDVVIIDIANGKIEKKIAIDSAVALNDITIAHNGIVFVSDSKTGKIWRLENDMVSPYMGNLKGLNGLKSVGDELIIAAGKSFIKADMQKNIKPIAELLHGGDGIEPVGNGDYIVTAWGGYIWYVHADGRIETLLETHQQKKNTADIGYDPVKKIVYVPTFNAKTVAAYQLK
jgi:hypothetical protein